MFHILNKIYNQADFHFQLNFKYITSLHTGKRQQRLSQSEWMTSEKGPNLNSAKYMIPSKTHSESLQIIRLVLWSNLMSMAQET